MFNPVNLALYHYAGNNPVKYVDPDGKVPIAAVVGYLAKGALIGAVTGFISQLVIEAGMAAFESYLNNSDFIETFSNRLNNEGGWGRVISSTIGGSVIGALTNGVDLLKLGKLVKHHRLIRMLSAGCVAMIGTIVSKMLENIQNGENAFKDIDQAIIVGLAVGMISGGLTKDAQAETKIVKNLKLNLMEDFGNKNTKETIRSIILKEGIETARDVGIQETLNNSYEKLKGNKK